MWTEAHRARHEARLKDMVRVSAVGEIARWLERADPPRSPRRTPLRWIVAALGWHLRGGGPWRGAARRAAPRCAGLWRPWLGTCGWVARGGRCPAAIHRGAPSMAGSGAGWRLA